VLLGLQARGPEEYIDRLAGDCFSAKMEAMMRDVKRGLWIAAFGIWLLVGATYVHAEEPKGVKGCYATYYSGDGKFRFEPFLKLGDKEYDSENGEAEIWGLRPWSESSKKDGKLVPVNVLESRFIPLNTAKEVPAGTMRRRIKCPDGFW
jgi:hypothetical protein